MEVIGGISGILQIISSVTKLAKELNEVRESYTKVALNTTLVASQLSTIRAALQALYDWRADDRGSSAPLKQLDKDLALSVSCCAVLITVLDAKLGESGYMPGIKKKVRYLWLEDILKDYISKLESQVRALQLLLTIFQCRTATEQQKKLADEESRTIIKQVRAETATLALDSKDFQDAASMLSMELSTTLDVDSILLRSPAYRRVYRDTRVYKRNADGDSMSDDSLDGRPPLPPRPYDCSKVPPVPPKLILPGQGKTNVWESCPGQKQEDHKGDAVSMADSQPVIKLPSQTESASPPTAGSPTIPNVDFEDGKVEDGVDQVSPLKLEQVLRESQEAGETQVLASTELANSHLKTILAKADRKGTLADNMEESKQQELVMGIVGEDEGHRTRKDSSNAPSSCDEVSIEKPLLDKLSQTALDAQSATIEPVSALEWFRSEVDAAFGGNRAIVHDFELLGHRDLRHSSGAKDRSPYVAASQSSDGQSIDSMPQSMPAEADEPKENSRSEVRGPGPISTHSRLCHPSNEVAPGYQCLRHSSRTASDHQSFEDASNSSLAKDKIETEVHSELDTLNNVPLGQMSGPESLFPRSDEQSKPGSDKPRRSSERSTDTPGKYSIDSHITANVDCLPSNIARIGPEPVDASVSGVKIIELTTNNQVSKDLQSERLVPSQLPQSMTALMNLASTMNASSSEARDPGSTLSTEAHDPALVQNVKAENLALATYSDAWEIISETSTEPSWRDPSTDELTMTISSSEPLPEIAILSPQPSSSRTIATSLGARMPSSDGEQIQSKLQGLQIEIEADKVSGSPNAGQNSVESSLEAIGGTHLTAPNVGQAKMPLESSSHSLVKNRARLMRFPSITGSAKGIALGDSAAIGDISSMSRLLNERVNVDSRSENYQTPLMRAARNGHLECLKLLKQNGADALAVDAKGRTALHLAVASNQVAAAKWLLAAFSPPKADNVRHRSSILFRATDAMKGVRAQKGLAEASDAGGSKPLHIAAERAKGGMLKTLIAAGVHIEAKNNWGQTPLHRAIISKRRDSFDTLLASNAQIEALDGGNRSSLHFAAEAGQVDMVEILLAKGAKRTICDIDGNQPIHAAAWGGSVPTIDALLTGQRDLDRPTESGTTMLHIACAQKNLELAKYLVANHVEVNSWSKVKLWPLDVLPEAKLCGSSLTPLHYACCLNDFEMVVFLLDHGAWINVPTPKGTTALMIAVETENTNLVNLLLQREAQVNASVPGTLVTAIHLAARRGDLATVQQLVQAGADDMARTHGNAAHGDFLGKIPLEEVEKCPDKAKRRAVAGYLRTLATDRLDGGIQHHRQLDAHNRQVAGLLPSVSKQITPLQHGVGEKDVRLAPWKQCRSHHDYRQLTESLFTTHSR